MKKTPLKPRTKRPNPVNRKRKAKRFQENFGGAEYVEHIQSLPCALCGVEGYSVAAHVKARGAGGKASDLVPLCRPRYTRTRSDFVLCYGCHVAYDTRAIPVCDRELLRIRAAELWFSWQRLHGEDNQDDCR